MVDTSIGKTVMIDRAPGTGMTEPLEDVITDLARRVWSRASAEPNLFYKGFHTCRCGKTSDNREWTVFGLKTNSLLVHYVACHRADVPREELMKLATIERNFAEVNDPTQEYELKVRWEMEGTIKVRATSKMVAVRDFDSDPRVHQVTPAGGDYVHGSFRLSKNQ